MVRYEYTPGFTELDAIATGGQAHVWVNDYIKVGLTTNGNEEGDTESSLDGADVTLRMSADSWLKVQGGRSEGLVSSAMYSDDGGFGFVNPDTDRLHVRERGRVSRRPERRLRRRVRRDCPAASRCTRSRSARATRRRASAR